MVITASCQCEQIGITIDGKPKFVNACACRNCQRQSGGPIGVGVFFAQSAFVAKRGVFKTYTRTTDKGNTATQYFCPDCGNELYWETGAVPGCYGVSWGAIDNNEGLNPNWLVWARSLPAWVKVEGIRHFDTQPDSAKK